MGFKTEDLSGKKFNFFTVIKQVPRPPNQKCNHTFWLCKCDCGNEKIVDQRALKSGNTKSCGCYAKTLAKQQISKYNENKPRKTNHYITELNKVRFFTKELTEFIVNKEDFEKVHSRYWVKRDKYISSKNPEGSSPRYIQLHRFILNNVPQGMDVDHINRNTFDNRRENLRIVTKAENNRNKGIPKNNKTGFLNVYYRKSKDKYEAQFTFQKKTYNLGQFENPEEANKAVLEKRKEIGGLLYDQRIS